VTPAPVRRAAGLLVVMVAGRVATLALRTIAGVDGGPDAAAAAAIAKAAAAGVRSDAWVVVVLVAVDVVVTGIASALSRRRMPRAARVAGAAAWGGYTIAAAYTAFNVPVAAVLGTPLTYPMLAGAGGALADSIQVYLTAANVGACLAVLVVAGLAPARLVAPVLGRLPRRSAGAALALALGALAVPVGPPVTPLAPAPSSPPATAARNAIATLAVTAWRHGIASRAAGATERATARGARPLGDRRGDLLATAEGGRDVGAGGVRPDPAARGGAVETGRADSVSGTDLRWLAGAAAGRNVVWIVLESTAAQYLAPYGADADPMPNVSALARRGIVFDHVYAVYPESIKGLYALLCAAEPAAYVEAAAYAAARRPCRSLAATLAAAGYPTALFHSGRFVYLGMAEMVADRGFGTLVDAAGVGGAHASSFGVDEAATVARIFDHVDRRDPARPFFVMYLPIAGHHPYESPGGGPRPFGEDSDVQRYLSDLHGGDAAIGTLLGGLAARGLMDNTLFVVSGDHGEAFHQHPGNFAHSLYLYEENVRVPLVIAAPGITDGAGRGDGPRADRAGLETAGAIHAPQVTSTIDIAPTVLDLLGIPAPAGFHGRSRLAPGAGVARFFTDHSAWLMGLRDGRWKFIHDADTGRDQLFDLAADPGETRDVAARHPELAARYRADLQRWSHPR